MGSELSLWTSSSKIRLQPGHEKPPSRAQIQPEDEQLGTSFPGLLRSFPAFPPQKLQPGLPMLLEGPLFPWLSAAARAAEGLPAAIQPPGDSVPLGTTAP